MSKGIYFGVSGIARKGKKLYIGIGGVARKIKKIYIGVGGVARLAWTSSIPAGQVVFTASQVWTVPEGVNVMDIFCVGGGGSGRTGYLALYSNGADNYEGSGGGGGYTKTVLNAEVTPGQQIAITVGAGGVGGRVYTGSMGGASSFGSLCTANGGRGGDSQRGGDGGSGGGANYLNWQTYPVNELGCAGATDGATNSLNRGSGQGTTTRAFATPGATLYSGGGGGCSSSSGYAGGDSTAGAGGASAGSGKVNTGGGGGGGLGTPWQSGGYGVGYSGSGGSGVVIVRWPAQ